MRLLCSSHKKRSLVSILFKCIRLFNQKRQNYSLFQWNKNLVQNQSLLVLLLSIQQTGHVYLISEILFCHRHYRTAWDILTWQEFHQNHSRTLCKCKFSNPLLHTRSTSGISRSELATWTKATWGWNGSGMTTHSCHAGGQSIPSTWKSSTFSQCLDDISQSRPMTMPGLVLTRYMYWLNNSGSEEILTVRPS